MVKSVIRPSRAATNTAAGGPPHRKPGELLQRRLESSCAWMRRLFASELTRVDNVEFRGR